MSSLQVPEFKSYEDEAAFWDNLDTADFMGDDGEWFHFDAANQKSCLSCDSARSPERACGSRPSSGSFSRDFG